VFSENCDLIWSRKHQCPNTTHLFCCSFGGVKNINIINANMDLIILDVVFIYRVLLERSIITAGNTSKHNDNVKARIL
jgi:hypothetical protein